jgi:hypothetical protein
VDADQPHGEITVQQGYDAAFLFLLEFWRRGAPPSEDAVEWLLLAMDRSTHHDGGSNDPAMNEDWQTCVRRIVEGFDPYPGAFGSKNESIADGQ